MSDFISEIQTEHIQKLQAQLANLERTNLSQVISKKDFQMWCESGEFSGLRRNFKDVRNLKNYIKEKEKVEKQLKKVEKKEQIASKFQKKNYEFKKTDLLSLRDSIFKEDNFETIIKKVLSFYPDYSLADEALNFLLETTTGTLKEEVLKAKEELLLRYERQIKAGKNILEESQTFSKLGIGTPGDLRSLYYDITGNVRPPEMLFRELSEKFNFDKLKQVIKYLFHSLGKDLKSKGPSISRAELIKLISDTKSLQAILGVYLFFRSRMPIINDQFAKNNMFVPRELNFEKMAKQFMKLISLRYLSPDIIYSLARELRIPDNVIAQIIVFSQMRDAIRQTSNKLYKSSKKRQEILEALIEALEEWEEEEEEEE